jgi:hypothetical protein
VHNSAPLNNWSRWLLDELFTDVTGDGRPVATILVDDELLRRGLAHGGIDANAPNARRLFLDAFPNRAVMVGWFGGTRDPGPALCAFLALCCFAAGEAVDIDVNDYRGRIAEILHWTDRVVNCAGLPHLWARLRQHVAKVAASGKYRPLVLPNPGFRKQIGHAIELTFPSRPDAEKLRTALAARSIERESPAGVLHWLAPSVGSGRFSQSFTAAFKNFEAAWRSGHRTLTDDRFWVGWRLILAGLRPPDEKRSFDILADEWGTYRLLGLNDQPFEFGGYAGAGGLPSAAAQFEREGRPFLLREVDWARWRWVASDLGAARRARAALIRPNNYSSQRLKSVDLASVVGAEGWAFTRSIDQFLSPEQRDSARSEELIDATIRGVPRVDGGLLGRPSFPITIDTSGPVGTVAIRGEGAESVQLERAASGSWLARLKCPLTTNLIIELESWDGQGSIARALRTRASILRPRIPDDPPERLADDEPPAPANWAPIVAAAAAQLDQVPAGFCAPSDEPTRSEVLDLVEYFAARPGPIALGAVIELLGEISDNSVVDKWDLLRAFFETGILRPLRNRGWRGRAVIAAPPRGVLRQSADGWAMILDGVVHEVLRSRLEGRARAAGLTFEIRPGVSEWTIPTMVATGRSLDELALLARDLELPTSHWRADLGDLTPLKALHPDADGGTYSVRRAQTIAGGRVLEAADVRLQLCQRDPDDAPRLWMVQRGDDEPRFWRLRHYALLDAFRLAKAPVFQDVDERLRVHVPGAYLPLPLARWLRLATAISSGPRVNGYLYGSGRLIEGQLREILGALVASSDIEVANRLPLVSRGRPGGRPLAVGGIGGGSTIELWRWARADSGRRR